MKKDKSTFAKLFIGLAYGTAVLTFGASSQALAADRLSFSGMM